MMPRARRLGLLGACAIALGGCDAIPVLRFNDDASMMEVGGDGSQLDASSSMDGSAETGCSVSPPIGVTSVCCGSVWCVGACEAGACAICETKGCTGRLYCCDTAGTQGCKSIQGRCL